MNLQTLESLFSLLFFITLISTIPQIDKKIDESIYLSHISEDSWRVLYLRGDFKDFDLNDEFKRIKIESDLRELGTLTNYCYFIGGIQYTNCRDAKEHKSIISTKKILITKNGPISITFTISLKD